VITQVVLGPGGSPAQPGTPAAPNAVDQSLNFGTMWMSRGWAFAAEPCSRGRHQVAVAPAPPLLVTSPAAQLAYRTDFQSKTKRFYENEIRGSHLHRLLFRSQL